MASGCLRKWRLEAAYLRFIHGFVQSAPQLILQSVIFLKGIHIHSLKQTVEAVQRVLQGQDQNLSMADALSYLTQDKPLRWYWGLIQVCTRSRINLSEKKGAMETQQISNFQSFPLFLASCVQPQNR